ncbi:long-chain fatty acid--CoA ligase [Actinomyces sp. F1_1611]
MTTFEVSPPDSLGSSRTVPQLYAERAHRYPGSVAVEKRTAFGGWQDVTIEELLSDVERVACGLIGLGVQPGENVAILAANSFEWMLLDLAIMNVGAVTVPIYESDSAAQIRHILEDADIRRVFTATLQQAELVASVQTDRVELIDSIDRGALRRIAQASRHVAPIAVIDRTRQIRAEDLATIIYTSGTTGLPKGVELTHHNFVTTSDAVHDVLPMIADNPQTRVLLFLPLAHVLARFVMHTLAVSPGRIAFSPDTSNLISDIAAFKPTALLAVPRVLEKVYATAQGKAGGGFKGKLFSWSARQAKSLSAADRPGALLRAKAKIADELVLKKIRAVLGSNLEYVVSGGAPLAADLAHFYRGLGITVLQGYGLSETTGPIAVQLPGANPPGKVGPLLPGNEVKISEEDSEILLRGNAVFRGYHNLPNTDLVDGWFHTGDIGSVDPDGQLRITGRKKGIIVTAGGKNVSPEVHEESLMTHPLIGQVIVVGDQKPFIGAIITLDPETLPVWLKNKGLPIVDPVVAAEMPEVQRSLQKAIDRANAKVSRAESIRKFRIVNAEFTVENGYLTPSLKLRRNQVLADYAEEVEAIYSE